MSLFPMICGVGIERRSPAVIVQHHVRLHIVSLLRHIRLIVKLICRPDCLRFGTDLHRDQGYDAQCMFCRFHGSVLWAIGIFQKRLVVIDCFLGAVLIFKLISDFEKFRRTELMISPIIGLFPATENESIVMYRCKGDSCRCQKDGCKNDEFCFHNTQILSE